MQTIHISLSDLIKQSAMQICHLRKKPELVEVTEQQLLGNDLALAKAKSEFLEMRGTYRKELTPSKEILIHYAFDEIIINPLSEKQHQVLMGTQLYLEHKNIQHDKPLEEWYVNSCILQLITYSAFNELNPSRTLRTAKFFIDQGYPMKTLIAKDPMRCLYQLRLNSLQIDVSTTNADLFVEYFTNKAIATLDYESAKAWDSDHKRQDYTLLKDHIKTSDIPWQETITRVLPVTV